MTPVESGYSMNKIALFAAALTAILVAVPAQAAPLTTQTVVSGLNRAVDLAVPPGDTQRLFVAERRGVIKIIDLTTNTVLPTPFLDIDSLVVNFVATGGDERGLLGFCFHPDYASNGYFYVNYMDTSASPGDTIIARYKVSADPNVADPASALILKTINQPQGNHNGGCMKFGPDGMLYIGTGDGGGDNDDDAGHTALTGNSQDKSNLLGKILRLDVDIAAPYIPADNPFVGVPGAMGEIWMFGLRNPFRFSFDPLTGDMYIGDVGQNAREEIDFIPAGTGAGRNLGWRCMEGLITGPYNPSGAECTSGGANLTLPVLQYLRNAAGGFSVTGGIVYRGSKLPGEYGNYFYGDYINPNLWSFKMVGGAATGNAVRISVNTTVAFCADGNGEMYIVTGSQQSASTTSGIVRKIVPLCNTTGDINADCLRDINDATILVDVLLDVPVADPALVTRSDINGDGFRDGLDIQAWISAL